MKPKYLFSRNACIVLAFVVLFLLFYLPDISFFLMTYQPEKLVSGLILISSIFLLPIILFRNHIKLYVILLSVLGFFSLLATIPIFYFGLPLDNEVMALIYNTSYNEASELMKGYLVPIIASILIYIIIAILIIKTVSNTISQSAIRKIVIICMAVIIIALILPITQSSGLKSYTHNLKGEIGIYYPFYIGIYGKKFYSEWRLVKMHPMLVKDFHFNSKQKRQISKRQIYVFFIGESSRYDHWGINGYHRHTSPLLSGEKNLMSFNDVCAAGGETELSVPMLMTQTQPDSFNKLFYHKGILSLFDEAGFHTWWISNQMDGMNVMMFAKEAQEMKFFQTMANSINRSSQNYNIELANYLKRIIQIDTGNLFIAIHSLGSHFAYNFRYPASFNYFRPSGGKSLMMPNQQNITSKYINAYDNSILYNDVVIDSTICVLKRCDAISFIYFISDHGENLNDNNDGQFLHDPVKPTKYVAHVPLFIYTSADYDSAFPQKVAALRSHLNATVSGTNTFNTIADMANLRFINQDTTRSLASYGFKYGEQIILGGDGKVYKFRELLPDILLTR